MRALGEFKDTWGTKRDYGRPSERSYKYVQVLL